MITFFLFTFFKMNTIWYNQTRLNLPKHGILSHCVTRYVSRPIFGRQLIEFWVSVRRFLNVSWPIMDVISKWASTAKNSLPKNFTFKVVTGILVNWPISTAIRIAMFKGADFRSRYDPTLTGSFYICCLRGWRRGPPLNPSVPYCRDVRRSWGAFNFTLMMLTISDRSDYPGEIFYTLDIIFCIELLKVVDNKLVTYRWNDYQYLYTYGKWIS